MTSFQAVIARYLRSIADAWLLWSRPACLLPFVLLSLIELLLLTGYVLFAISPFSSAWPAVMTALFGEEVLHYPTHILLLPRVLSLLRVGVGLVAGFLMMGWGMRLIMRCLSDEAKPLAGGWKGVILPLFVVNAVCTGLIFTAPPAFDLLGEMRIIGRLKPAWQLMSVLTRPVMLVVVAYAMFYAMSAKGRSIIATLRHSANYAFDRSWETVLIAVTALVLSVPFGLPMTHSEGFVLSGRPGLVVVSVMGAVLWDVVVRFFLFASAASLEMNRSERRENSG